MSAEQRAAYDPRDPKIIAIRRNHGLLLPEEIEAIAASTRLATSDHTLPDIYKKEPHDRYALLREAGKTVLEEWRETTSPNQVLAATGTEDAQIIPMPTRETTQ